MAFPVVAATNTTNSASTASYAVNLPAGIVAGDLLIILFATDNRPTITSPVGWNDLINFTSAEPVILVCWRIADGSEGSTATITLNASQPCGAVSWRITTYAGVPEITTSATGSSINPDSPNLTPSWGDKQVLWLPMFSVNSANGSSITSPPSNYTNTLTNNNFRVGAAQRQLKAASEDPGSFTLSGSETWRAVTVGVRGTDDVAFAADSGLPPAYMRKIAMVGYVC